MTAQQAKFQMEFMATMLMSGREEEAVQAYNKVLNYLTKQIEEENDDE